LPTPPSREFPNPLPLSPSTHARARHGRVILAYARAVPPAPDPFSNPYAPPATEIPSRTAGGDGFSYANERRSVWLLILLVIVTFTIYSPVWYVRRARFFDSLSADKKVGPLPWIFVVALALNFIAAVAGASDPILRVAQLFSGISSLAVAFRMAHILRSDFARTGRQIGVSGAGVFFFGCLYLQHVLNEAADTPARLPTT
jgi:hypothetical protein